MHDSRSLGSTQAGFNDRTRLCLDEQRHGSRPDRGSDMEHVDMGGIVSLDVAV